MINKTKQMNNLIRNVNDMQKMLKTMYVVTKKLGADSESVEDNFIRIDSELALLEANLIEQNEWSDDG